MDRTRRAIRDMLAVGEAYVWRLEEDGREVQIPVEQVRVRDRIVVKTGEKISVDGVIEQGEAAVDQASITGEFMPMRKQIGDAVFAGTVVKAGHLTVLAKKVGDDTAVARIVHLVEEAAHRKATIQAFADRFSARFIPVNFGLAGIVYAATHRPDRALNMLIIDYSCGVRLSTATALSAAIATAARNGILIKGSNYLEMLAEADTHRPGQDRHGNRGPAAGNFGHPGGTRRRGTRDDRAGRGGRGNLNPSRSNCVCGQGAPQRLAHPGTWADSRSSWSRGANNRRRSAGVRGQCALHARAGY